MKSKLPKQILAAALAVAIMSSTAWAADTKSGVKSASNTKTSEESEPTNNTHVDGVRILDIEEAQKIAKTATGGTMGRTIRTMSDNINYLEKSRDGSWDIMQNNLASAAQAQPIIDASMVSLRTLANNVTSTKYQKEILELSSDLAVLGAFQSIDSLKESLAVQKTSLDLDQLSLNQSVKLNQLGKLSSADLESAKKAFEIKKEQYRTTEIKLENAYDDLKEFLGFSLDEKIDIRYTPDTTKYELGMGIETYINRAVSTSLLVKSAKLGAETAEYKRTLSDYADTYDEQSGVYSGLGYVDYENDKIAVAEANRAVKNARADLESGIRSNYQSLKNLENSINTAELNVELKQQSMDTAKIKYELGKITELEYKKTVNEYEEAKSELNQAAKNYEVIKFQFDNPDLMSGGSSSGGSSGGSSQKK